MKTMNKISRNIIIIFALMLFPVQAVIASDKITTNAGAANDLTQTLAVQREDLFNQIPPARVVIVFDNTGSMKGYLDASFQVVSKFMENLFNQLQGNPDDKVVFIALNNKPTVIHAASGNDLRFKAEREFLSSFSTFSKGLGTDVVGALELACFELYRQPQPCLKYLLIFSDCIVDPDPKQAPFRPLDQFDWSGLKEEIHSYVFFINQDVNMKMGSTLESAGVRVYSTADMGISKYQKYSEQVFKNRMKMISQRFQDDIDTEIANISRQQNMGNMNIKSIAMKFLPFIAGLLVIAGIVFLPSSNKRRR